MSTLLYVKNLLHDRYVASVTPTSHFAVEKLCGKMDFSRDRLVVEYGPGTGVFTDAMLNLMTPASRLVAIERNHDFCRVLEKKISDRRLAVFNQCAGCVIEILHTGSESQADYVISGIPFSYLAPEKRKEILQATYRVLKKGGKFLAYQTFYQPSKFLKIPLEDIFPVVRTQLALLCIPPLLLFEAIKEG
ncbi:MAG TPA: methyltransferase domain-containing protein [Syntrophales bacterium]|jgi:phospholipid N-methyltransferase|nr:methyltransferase domain-containing protein [Syntrophales bacterium]HRT61504.1 methyltransferase domain-containing protein [Syntrophales bacterium]